MKQGQMLKITDLIDADTAQLIAEELGHTVKRVAESDVEEGLFDTADDPAMLVIDPDTCIDCHLCVPECPVHAIYPEHEVPDPYKEWTAKNRELFPEGTNITTKKDSLPGALKLDQVKAREAQNGWDVSEPTEA